MLSPVFARITRATGRTFSPYSTPEEAVDYLIGDRGWWPFCLSDDADLATVLGESNSDHQVIALIGDYEPDLTERVIAVAHAAYARVASDPRAEIEAARRWIGGPDDEAAADGTAESLRAEFPQWGWQPVRMLVHEPTVVRETRTTVILPDRRIGQLVLTVVASNGPDGFWPDPRTMMFAEISPEVQAQLADAWMWAVNQDRFHSGHTVFWTLLAEDVPLRRVGAHPIGPSAAAALSFALGLSARSKRIPRMDTVLVADMEQSGALAPIPPAWTPVFPPEAPKPRVLLADRQAEWEGREFTVRRVGTVGEAVGKLRRPRPGLGVTTLIVAVVIAVAGAFVIGGRVTADAERDRRDKQADQLAILASQNQRPDEAILLALAAEALGPTRALPQDSLLQVLHASIGLDAVLPPAHGAPRAVALSSTTAATGASDGTIALQNIERRTASVTVEKLAGPVEALAFSPDSRWLAAAGGNQLIVYDTAEGRTAWRSGLNGAQALAFDAQSAVFAAGGATGDVVLHSLQQDSERRMKRGTGAIRALALLPGGLLVAGGDDRKLEVLDPATDPPAVRAAFDLDTAVTSIAINAKRNRFAATEYDGRIHAYAIDTLTPAEGPVRSALGAQLITAPGGGPTKLSATNAVLDFDATGLSSDTKPDEAITVENRYPSGAERLGAVAVSPDGARTAVPEATGALLLWRPPGRKIGKKGVSITDAAPVPGTNLILVASGGSALQEASGLFLLDRDSGQIVDLKRSSTPYDAVLGSPFAFDPASGTAVVRTRDGEAQVYEVHARTLARVTAISKDKGPVTAVAFDLAHRRLLIARERDVVAIPLDRLSSPSETPVYHATGVVDQIMLTPDGRGLVFAGRNKGVLVVSLDEHGRISGDGQSLTSQRTLLTVMSEQGTVVTATAAGTMTAYRRNGGEWLPTSLPGHAGQVTALTTVGDLVVSGGADAEIHAYDLRSDRSVFTMKLGVRLMPKVFWHDGPTVVSSSDMSFTSIDLVLDPTAAVRTACALGGWGATRPRIRDVAPAAAAEYGDIKLCAAGPESP